MISGADFRLYQQQVIVSSLLHFLWHIVFVQLMGLGARPGAVLEDEAVLELGKPQQLPALLELLFRLTTEANDVIAADRHARNGLPAPLHHLFVKAYGVEPLHSLEHDIIAMLSGHVQVM